MADTTNHHEPAPQNHSPDHLQFVKPTHQHGDGGLSPSPEHPHDHDHPHPHGDEHDHPHPHGHDHPHPHDHDHDHDHSHDHGSGPIGWIRTVFHWHGHDHTPSELASDQAFLSHEEGIRTVWLALAALALTSVLQVFIVFLSGSVALLGIPPGEMAIDWNQVIFKGLTIKGIYGREMFETWYKMASMLQSGLDVTPVITHRFAANDYLEGFRTMGSGQSGKVILDWA